MKENEKKLIFYQSFPASSAAINMCETSINQISFIISAISTFSKPITKP